MPLISPDNEPKIEYLIADIALLSSVAKTISTNNVPGGLFFAILLID